MVVAVIALFVALGGSGYAASQSGGGDKTSANAAAKKKVKRGRRGPRDFQGLAGPQGLQGPQGQQGSAGTSRTNVINGANGSPAFGALLGPRRQRASGDVVPGAVRPAGRRGDRKNEVDRLRPTRP